MLVCIAPLSACCHLDQPNYLCNCRLVLHAVPQRPPANPCPCTLPLLMHLLHTASVYDGLYPPMGDIVPVHHPEQPVLHALLLQSPWRLGTARPNVQHGAGAPHGHFSPMRRSTRVLCAHRRLSAREELQDISRTPETQPTPHLLRIPPPLFP